ncbi:hypothetical protein LIER_09931 [Lithospermum erythrorhizon]|uniref:Uncharacterized protein n=1 Tax=Lithospermum erythrorhizon TaxID=34254 RepID=A0AAV3PHM7_LITER
MIQMVTTTNSSSNPPPPPTNPPPHSPPAPIPEPQTQIQTNPDLIHDLTSAIQVLSAKVTTMSTSLPHHPLNDGSLEGSHRGINRARAPPYDRGRGRGWEEFDDDEEHNCGFHQPRNPRAKIDFPKFDGGDPRGWC